MKINKIWPGLSVIAIGLSFPVASRAHSHIKSPFSDAGVVYYAESEHQRYLVERTVDGEGAVWVVSRGSPNQRARYVAGWLSLARRGATLIHWVDAGHSVQLKIVQIRGWGAPDSQSTIKSSVDEIPRQVSWSSTDPLSFETQSRMADLYPERARTHLAMWGRLGVESVDLRPRGGGCEGALTP